MPPSETAIRIVHDALPSAQRATVAHAATMSPSRRLPPRDGYREEHVYRRTRPCDSADAFSPFSFVVRVLSYHVTAYANIVVRVRCMRVRPRTHAAHPFAAPAATRQSFLLASAIALFFGGTTEKSRGSSRFASGFFFSLAERRQVYLCSLRDAVASSALPPFSSASALSPGLSLGDAATPTPQERY